jgi:hypothetical protein
VIGGFHLLDLSDLQVGGVSAPRREWHMTHPPLQERVDPMVQQRLRT